MKNKKVLLKRVHKEGIQKSVQVLEPIREADPESEVSSL